MKSSEFNKLSKAEKGKVKFKDLPAFNKFAMIFFFATIIGVISIFMFTDDTEAAKENAKKDMSTNAFIIAEGIIKDRLKSPATADFPLLDREIKDLGDDRYKVTSYVDSQNGFGAMIRTKYMVQLKYKGGEWTDGKNWAIEDITMQ